MPVMLHLAQFGTDCKEDSLTVVVLLNFLGRTALFLSRS
jgi:hypothetical protein